MVDARRRRPLRRAPVQQRAAARAYRRWVTGLSSLVLVLLDLLSAHVQGRPPAGDSPRPHCGEPQQPPPRPPSAVGHPAAVPPRAAPSTVPSRSAMPRRQETPVTRPSWVAPRVACPGRRGVCQGGRQRECKPLLRVPRHGSRCGHYRHGRRPHQQPLAGRTTSSRPPLAGQSLLVAANDADSTRVNGVLRCARVVAPRERGFQEPGAQPSARPWASWRKATAAAPGGSRRAPHRCRAPQTRATVGGGYRRTARGRSHVLERLAGRKVPGCQRSCARPWLPRRLVTRHG